MFPFELGEFTLYYFQVKTILKIFSGIWIWVWVIFANLILDKSIRKSPGGNLSNRKRSQQFFRSSGRVNKHSADILHSQVMVHKNWFEVLAQTSWISFHAQSEYSYSF